MVQNGLIDRNEARERENLAPQDGGEMLTTMSNYVPVDQLGKAPDVTTGQTVMEFKDFDINGAELKLDADSRVFTGYASTFGNVDSYGDTILPGAYKSVIAGDTMPVMFYGHDWSSIPIASG